jgi:type III restriction enzyme
MYRQLADMACERIMTAITRAYMDERPIRAVLDSYNPEGSTTHVRFNTSKTLRWQTDPGKCHVNWVILDSEWEGEFCRVVESHPKVFAYVKNHGLGFEVPYQLSGVSKIYRPDFIVLVDDGRGASGEEKEKDFLRLIVEIKGYRGEDAKAKKETMETYWIPGVNELNVFGRWAFAEFTDVFEIQDAFDRLIDEMTDEVCARG